MFQSTHPQRMRPYADSLVAYTMGFNPRIRKGCDGHVIQGCKFLGVSIHASAKDATCYRLSDSTSHQRFQSTHPQRMRLRYVR